jgi:hypothetical protein
MPGSATANLLQKSPLELAIRAVLAFGIALWLSTLLGPGILESLRHYYETVVYQLDDRYWINFTLTHQTGHNRLGSDLVLLGRAEVMKAFTVSAAGKIFTLLAGQALTCSTAIGILMQPAIMLVGVLLAWPLDSAKAALGRAIWGVVALAFWLFVGIPLSLWIYFYDIPVRAFAPGEVLLSTIIGKFLLNGGGLVLGGLLAIGVLAAGARWAGDAVQPDRTHL